METLRLLVLACFDRAYRSSPTQRRPPPATRRYCPPLSANSPIWKLLWGHCPSIRGWARTPGTTTAVHLDLKARGPTDQIAERDAKTPIQAGGRWVVERTNSWMNNSGKLRPCTERRRAPIEFLIALAGAIITVRCLIRGAWPLYRWDTRPRSPPHPMTHAADADGQSVARPRGTEGLIA
ncbi:hypothetical protein CG723_27875 [Streptomyces sp. CB01635]|nr:hypothetical protein CG723_27875 [Streptomyces sp. CB01635]